MRDLRKYSGIFPALYACYDDEGQVSPQRVQEFTRYLIDKGVQGLYVGGSSGECIFQSLEERKLILENVMQAAAGKIVIIAHIACPSTQESIMLAKHAADCGADALSAVPPIYYSLSEAAVAQYWKDIVQATDLDFFIYNIPQTTPYTLSVQMLEQMCKLPQVIGVKNSSMPVLDIQKWKMFSKKDFVVFNGPDEQYIAGRIMGAQGGIGGTYGVMSELFLQAEAAFTAGDVKLAQQIQMAINECIFAMFNLCSQASIYSVIKEILRQKGMNIGLCRRPFLPLAEEQIEKASDVKNLIEQKIAQFSS